MPIPAYPVNLIPRPFAANGTFQIIPDAKSASGRASWQEGFPVETQLPLTNGGIAPSRPDFNGIFNMLSALGYWQQAGGLFIYSAVQDYNTPAVVFHDNMLWFCKAPNGPDTVAPGVVTPGTDTDYWIDFLTWLSVGGSGSSGAGLNPVGTVIMFYGTEAPAGYLACDGSAFSVTTYPLLYALLEKATTPDMRGLFVRGYDPASTKDPDGSTRALGSEQNDAMRNLMGNFTCHDRPPATGVFHRTITAITAVASGSGSTSDQVTFDASRQVPTASEFRGKNINLLYCIKHD